MTPRIGLALGGGAAAGIAHVPVLQGFDDLGVKPNVIVGTSIGALIGALYASGVSGDDLADHIRIIGRRPIRSLMKRSRSCSRNALRIALRALPVLAISSHVACGV